MNDSLLRNGQTAVRQAVDEIHRISTSQVTLMEVCGTHTASIHRYGIPELLPATITLLSGPGCPVCVSAQSFIDKAIAISKEPRVIMTTYGDLLRVHGSGSSLEKTRAAGADVRVVYSVMDALSLARELPESEVVFLGIGFETTAPASAYALETIRRESISNFSFLSAHKVMPPALKAICKDSPALSGLIAPGHVSAITGWQVYEFIPAEYSIGVAVAGFEPLDILQAILMLVKQAETGTVRVENQYRRVVKKEGNIKAKALMESVFEVGESEWRGIGSIPMSGLTLSERYRDFDAEKRFRPTVPDRNEDSGCICGEILTGRKKPGDCPLFATRCTPENPSGACMVSSEGTCAIFYRFNRKDS